MKLLQLIKSVADGSLTKDQLEDYYFDLSKLYAEMRIEFADVEKEKAVFFIEKREKSDIATQRAWDYTKGGQRGIELHHYLKAVEKMLDGVKARIYQHL